VNLTQKGDVEDKREMKVGTEVWLGVSGRLHRTRVKDGIDLGAR